MKQIFSTLIYFFILTIIFSFFTVKNTEAKLLPQAKGVSQNTAAKNTGGANINSGVGVSPKLRGDRMALIVNFSNLQNATNVSYSLTYNTSTQPEGAMGSLPLTSSTSTNELLFGTCSKNVCRYHTGISNTKLDVSYTLKNGKKYLKRYRIKV